MTNVEYRHPTIEDVEAMTDVFNRNSREIPLHQDDTVEETLAFTFKEDDYDAKGFLLAIIDGEIIGYGGSHVQKHRIVAGKNDAWITIAIIPEKRNIGIEQHFMDFGLEYLRSRKIGTAKRWCYGLDGWRHEIGIEYGFKDVRHSYTMVWKHDKAPEAIPPPEKITLEHMMFKEANDEIVSHFVDNFNSSFIDHYDFSIVLLKDFIKWRDMDRNVTRMTFAKKEDEIIGVMMYEISNVYNEANNAKVGWANVLGVNPPNRKSGIGRTLLSTCMRWLYDQGMDTIYLGMDAENAKALDLYTSLGYDIHKESVNYKLDL
ncbi:MAG: GNAT family N-acetyltransferase [Thermoplasmata archaeon]|nr:GNAT family N-acetyltransferase [Thermoplasmata archaeon]